MITVVFVGAVVILLFCFSGSKMRGRETENELSDFAEDISKMKQSQGDQRYLSDILIDTSKGTMLYQGKILENVIHKKGDQQLINSETAEQIAQDLGMSISGKEDVTVGDFAEDIGASVTENEDGKLVVAKDFQTCRIVVKSDRKITDDKALAISKSYKDIYVLQYKNEAVAKEACERFKQLHYVRFAEPDRIVSLTGLEYTDFNKWGAQQCGFEEMQNHITGKYGNDISEVVVAVIDSGLDFTHSAFNGRVWEKGYDFVNGDADVTDDMGHGTMVGGVITMNTPSYVKILPIKAADDGGQLTNTDIYASIEYAVEKKVHIINMSFRSFGFNSLQKEAVKDASAKGITLVAAYGNDGLKTDDVYPACLDNVIAVSAVDSEQKHSFFSNYGSGVDITAPGTEIYTACTKDNDSSGYISADGTSFAAPFVSAGLAMLSVSEPDATPQQLEELLYANAADIGEEGWDEYYGNGMLCFDNYANQTYIAKIKDKKYQTLEAAFSDAADGDTIRIIGDMKLNQTLVCDKNISVISDRKYTIKRAEQFTGAFFQVKKGASLTLGDTRSDKASEMFLNGQANTGQKVESIVQVEKGAGLNLGNGLKIQNNKTSVQGSAVECLGEISISGKICISPENDIYLSEASELKVQSVLAEGQLVSQISLEKYTEGKEVVLYKEGITPERYAFALKNSDYCLKIANQSLVSAKNAEAAAKNGETTYQDLQTAVAFAEPGDKIEVLRDIELESPLTISKDITIYSKKDYWLKCADKNTEGAIIADGSAVCTIKGMYILGNDKISSGNTVRVSGSAALTLENICVTGQDGESTKAALVNDSRLNCINVKVVGNRGDKGGGIYNTGILVLQDSRVEKNHASTAGGGIYNTGTLSILNSQIRDNRSEKNGGGIFNEGTIDFESGNINSNSTETAGAGVYNLATFTMKGGSVSYNECTYIDKKLFASKDDGQGGGIWNKGTLTIQGGEIKGNKTNISGGGIFNRGEVVYNAQNKPSVQGGQLYLQGGIISENIALNSSGGVYSSLTGYGGGIFNSGEVHMSGGEIVNNEALMGGAGVHNAYRFTMTEGTIDCNRLTPTEQSGTKSDLGSAICNTPWMFEMDIVPVFSITGGYLNGDRQDTVNEDMTLEGVFEIGGDVGFGDEFAIRYSKYGSYKENAYIKVIQEFSKEFPKLTLVPDFKQAGDILVTFSEGITPETSRFKEASGRPLKITGNNIVLSDKIEEPKPTKKVIQTVELLENSFVYDGGEKTPQVIVKDQDGKIVDSSQYEVVYENNIQAGTATVTVTAKENYEGTVAEEFLIKRAAIKTVSLSTTNYVYDGEAKTPEVTVVDENGHTVEAGNYEVTYSDNVNAGTARVTVEAKGNYEGIIAKEFTIVEPVKKVIQAVELSENSYVYDGSEKTPQVAVKDENGETVDSSQYELVYENNVQAGTAKVTVTAKEKGEYEGTVTEEFFIRRAVIKTVTLSTTSYIYDGEAKTPEVTVVDENGHTVDAGNYEITYRDNIYAGTAKVIVEAKGNYEGTVIEKFTIAEPAKKEIRTVELSEERYVYDGSAKTPQVTVKDEDGKIVDACNYEVTYIDNIYVGTAKVIVTGKGNYTGRIEKAFYITDVEPVSITLNATGVNLYKGNTYTLEAKIMPGDATNKTIRWSTSNSNVAIVTDDGTVKAMNHGTATITAKTSNGKTATCKITVPYTIKYNLNGGTNNRSNPSSYYGKMTLQNPTRRGYNFAGWYRDSAYKTKITGFTSGNQTVYAKWTRVVYKIYYALNGGGAVANPKSYTVSTATITLKNPTRKGYTFAGWYTTKDFKTKATTLPKGSTGTRRYYAKWVKVSTPQVKTISLSNSGSKKLKVKYTKVSGAKGYQIYYALDRNFTKGKKSVNLRGLERVLAVAKNKTYYVKVRAYKLDSQGNRIYSSWSRAKSIKINR